MKIAILGSKHPAMNELILEAIFKIDGVDKSNTEIVMMEEPNLSGAVFKDGKTRGYITQTDYHNSILWREKIEYKKDLEEVLKQLKNKRK